MIDKTMEEDGLFARLRSGWNKYRNSRTQEIEKQEIENPAEHYANVMGTTIAWQKHLPLLRATDELYSPEKFSKDNFCKYDHEKIPVLWPSSNLIATA